jgi:hypothetical protein
MNCQSYQYQKYYIKAWQTKNKEELRIIRSQKYQCDCGSNIRISDLAKHKRTYKHKSFEITNYLKLPF